MENTNKDNGFYKHQYFQQIEDRFDKIDTQFQRMEERFKCLEDKIDEINGKMKYFIGMAAGAGAIASIAWSFIRNLIYK